MTTIGAEPRSGEGNIAAAQPAARGARSERRRVILAGLTPVMAYLALASVRIIRRARLNFDEHIFLDVGRHIADTGLPTRTYGAPHPALFFDHTPLYVYLVALLTAIGGPTVLMVRSTTLVFGVLTVMLVFIIGLRVHGLGSALVGSMLLAVSPFFATYGWFVRMEVPLCFFLVLAVYELIDDRFLSTGLAIAVAVMLKEIALAFWLVAVVYVFARRGMRDAALVAVPAPVAFFAWLAYADDIGHAQLVATIQRWTTSVTGGAIVDKRLHVGLLAWSRTIVGLIVGPSLIFASGAASALAATWRSRIPPITIVPVAYVLVAITASYVIRLKEPRFLIAIIPMLALTVAMVVDWDDAWARIRERTHVLPVDGASTQ